MAVTRPLRILSAVFVAASLPYLIILLFPAQLDRVMDGASYLVFHNVAEFFSIMVSLSVFGVGWYAYDQSRDRHALFLGTAFLAIGIIDFMHAMSSAAMPAFLTANSTNKSSQYWIAARLLDSAALFSSAFVLPERRLRWLTKGALLTAALAVSGIVFTGITFFPSQLPQTFVPGVGLTHLKVVSEYLVITLLLLALAAYWRRMKKTGDALLVHYMAAFVIGIFGEIAFASYKVDFGTHNVIGHIYKVAAFYLIYKGAFAAAVRKPYLQLTRANEKLSREVSERQAAEEQVRALNAELEQRVVERTFGLEAANRELGESREWLRVTLSSIGDAVLACDTAGRVTFVNPVAGALSGWSIDAVGQPAERVFKTIDEQTGAPGEDIIGRVLRQGRAAELANHTALVTRDGRKIPVEDSAAPILDANGAVSGVVLVFHDVSEKRRAEQALREANEQLREADHRKDEFIGMLSHELRNPLAPIRNSVYVLKHAGPGSDQALRAQAVIERQAQHLTRLVDDLLDVTRIARGKIELRRSRLDLREVVTRAADDFRSMMDERGLVFRVAVPGTKVWADADPARVTQVVSNLLHNAAKFTSRGGEVTVTLSLRAVDQRAHLSVRDSGAGIAPALLPRIFEPFVQGDRSLERSDSGLGLGLALVKGITELHGGIVHAHSAGIGKGAELAVILPIVGAPVQTLERASEQHSHRSRRVLVVDDNRDGAESLAQVVEILGHSAEVAYDGPTAIEKARANPPEIVLCDIGLPGMSGYEIAKRLRTASTGMQLYAVSGYAQADDVRQAAEAGFDGHIAKPVNVADIKRLLG